MNNQPPAAPQYTAENSKPSKIAPIADGEQIGNWVPCGHGQERRRKVVYSTKFVDYANSFTGKRSQWWNQDQTHFTQTRNIGDDSDILVSADIWRRERCDAQGLGIESI
jgi:hypothetical protein